jgi:hypothetical protein
MILEESIHAILTNSASVADIVGNGVYPMVIPQRGKLPAVTYMRVSSQYDTSVDGTGSRLTARVQIDCWCRSYSEAKRLSEAVRNAMVAAGHLVQSERDGFEDDLYIYSVGMDFSCRHKEA